MTDDDVVPVEARLREAPWDLPVSDAFVAAVLERRARRRRATPVWAAAAVVLVVAGALGVRSGLLQAPAPAGGAPAVSPSPASTAAPSPRAAGVVLGGWTFPPPPGFTAAPQMAISDPARFGPEGLLNDGETLRPQDMSVSLRSWAFTSAGGGRLYVTQILPHPSAEHPGPRPAADPADVDAAARTIIAIESARGVGEDAAQPVAGLPLGPATLVRFDDRNGILLASPVGSPAQVLLLQVGGAPVDTLVALARSAHR
jgi:hypothetical protein